jgi:hypothetical protein
LLVKSEPVEKVEKEPPQKKEKEEKKEKPKETKPEEKKEEVKPAEVVAGTPPETPKMESHRINGKIINE